MFFSDHYRDGDPGAAAGKLALPAGSTARFTLVMVTVELIVHELDKCLAAPNPEAVKVAVEVFRRRVHAIDPSTMSAEVLEVIDDLAFDLAGYEPDEHCRDDPSLLDEAGARREIEQARDRLASSRGGNPHGTPRDDGDSS